MSSIKPSNINAGERIRGAFGSRDMEEAAAWVVRFCQSRDDSWSPFSLRAIDAFYAEHTGGTFDFGGLVVSGFVVGGSGDFKVTPGFIRRCHRASPA